MNIIVGENNVGKSNLIRMIEIVGSCLTDNQKNVTDDDYHKGNNNATIRIELTANLDKNDIEILMNEFKVPLNSIEGFLHIFGDQLTIHTQNSISSKWEPILVCIGRMHIYSKSQGSLFERRTSGINKPDAQWILILLIKQKTRTRH